jgi:hypothetical protein
VSSEKHVKPLLQPLYAEGLVGKEISHLKDEVEIASFD